MSEIWCRLRGLCLPPLGLACLDAALTLLGQSPEYWGGNYGQVSELSPTFAEAAARKIDRIELDVWSLNGKAQRFFAQHGFAVFNQRMEVNVGQA
jgi:hypothetical protein